MLTIGKWLRRVDTPEGSKEFQELYDHSYQEYIRNYELDYVTKLTVNNYPYVVFIESDGDFNQVFILGKEDQLYVFSDGCMAKEGRVFNTDGMAFVRLNRDNKFLGTFSVENSPYDMEENDSDWEYFEITKEAIMKKLNDILADRNIDETHTHGEATLKNTLFVRQL